VALYQRATRKVHRGTVANKPLYLSTPPAIERGGECKSEAKKNARALRRETERWAPAPSEIVNSETGRQPIGAALMSSGSQLSRHIRLLQFGTQL
jgi:hypothetical protein